MNLVEKLGLEALASEDAAGNEFDDCRSIGPAFRISSCFVIASTARHAGIEEHVCYPRFSVDLSYCGE